MSENETSETSLNFRDIEADCRQLGITVEEYLFEHAARTFELYQRWKRKEFPRRRIVMFNAPPYNDK